MQGVLVAVVPVLIAAFALLMDKFESRILAQSVPAEPEQTASA